jgi:hypothetical protein
MIVTDGFVFLHLHKSGGSFVNEFLKRFYPSAREIGYHLPWSLVPDTHADLPALGLVRNPWSYYVSWYTFQKERPRQNALFRILSDDGRLEFEPTIRNMLDLGSAQNAQLEALVAALPPGYGGRGLNLPGPALAPIAGTGLGFYSFLYRHMYNGAGRAFFVRMEHLRDELLKMLTGAGQSVTGPMREWVAAAPARNVSAHGKYVDYYGTELRNLVAERDAKLIAAHGYRFGEFN